MVIAGVAACTAGIAHTYIAREKLIQAAVARGHKAYVETQGTIGTEFKLTEEQIKEADIIVLAVDIKIKGEERFKGKRVVRVGTSGVIKNPLGFIGKLEEAMNKK